MKFPFGHIIDYAHSKPHLAQEAFSQFFKGIEIETKEKQKEYFPLFAEWLIFDFHQPSGISFINEYVLKNPDRINEKTLNHFKQIAESQFYGGFEIVDIKRGESMQIEHLFHDKIYKVFDTAGSASLPEKGTIIGRIAKVDDKWYLVGSNPFYLPSTFTTRLKKILRGQEHCSSPRDALHLFHNKTKYTETPNLTQKDIKNKRKELEKNYNLLTKKFNFKLTFNEIVEIIYEENDDAPLDLWDEIIKKGIPKEVFFKYTSLFQDIWNYFPHKILKGKSPVEMYQSARRK